MPGSDVGGTRGTGRGDGRLRRAARTALARLAAAAAEPLERRTLFAGSVVINEIHYDPDVKTDAVEFVELTNPGDAAVDLSGAAFTNGIGYTFPAGTTLAAGGYLLVAESPAAVQAKFGLAALPLGPFAGSLSNEGENLVLRDAGGRTLDAVDYGAGFPWPTVGNAPGYSIELVNPALDNNLGGNWRSAVPGASLALFGTGSGWRYRKGTTEPTPGWRTTPYDEDGTWQTGTAPIGYDASVPMGTQLADMNGSYTTVYLRKTFAVADPAAVSSLKLDASYDDGFVVWVNGQVGRRVNAPADNGATGAPANTATAPTNREDNRFETFELDPALLRAGSNLIVVQVFNSFLSGSSDAFFDAKLTASTARAGPTPGRANAALAANAAPAVRQVSHAPQQPTAGQAVTITAKATDPDGVAAVNLSYQLVDPGSYVALEDAAYNAPANWTTVAMRDDGTNGDAAANDGTYTVVLPAALQTHRRLVRYRITATDGVGASVTGPYPDDPVPNFAYYVYNGVPTWTGAVQPGAAGANGTPVTYGASALGSTAVYQLITRRQDHVESQHIPNAASAAYGGDNYLWSGAFVYDGVVYDHIHYRARGGVWRYAMGKNMWKVDFNRGHDFRARDAYGNLFPVAWTKLNLGANIQQGDIGMRGEQGLFESLGFQMFNLAGVPASYTLPVQFRIVEGASELGDPANQYDDDFQGMYLAVEQDDGRFLDAHGLPDGNFYRMESGTGPGGGTLNNQGPTQPNDNSDLVAFRNALSANPTDQWIRDHIDLDSYYSYKAIVKAIHHMDIGFGKNFYLYHDPATDKWKFVPWDLDLTWYVNYSPGGGDSDIFEPVVLSRAVFLKEYRNRVREIRDLLYNNDQVAKLADAYAAMVNPAGGGPTLLQADRAMWDYNPIVTSAYVNASKAGAGRFYAGGQPTRDFAGMVARLKSWAADRAAFIDANVLTAADEAAAPRKPTVAYAGPAAFPANRLSFSTSGFVAGNLGFGFAAMQWRLADVTPAAAGQPPRYEADPPAWESGVLATFGATVAVPGNVAVAGHTYRLRARFKDADGRWGHWSDATAGATEFTAGTALGDPNVKDWLRVTELHYHPGPKPAGSTFADEDFEFVEFRNVGPQPVNLDRVRLTDAVTLTFGDVTLAAGEVAVVVPSEAAFRERYGPGLRVLGTYAGNLSNAGEHLLVSDAAGLAVQDFTFDDDPAAGWYAGTDGGGPTLVVRAPASNPNLSQAASWRPSYLTNGTPGIDETTVPPPAVQAVAVNDGAAQRSAVTSLTVTFDAAVTVAAGGFTLAGRSAGGPRPVALTAANPSGDNRTFVLTFSGTEVASGSLVDGVYDLRVSAAAVAGRLVGTPMAADATAKFHRLYSDADGDGDSDNSDLFQFRSSYGRSAGDPAYRAYFDFDADADVDNADLFQVRSRRSVEYKGY